MPYFFVAKKSQLTQAHTLIHTFNPEKKNSVDQSLHAKIHKKKIGGDNKKKAR